MTVVQERPATLTDDVILAPEANAAEVHERHFGNIEFRTLEVNSLIIFSQIRDKQNPRYAELEESIDKDDLDNPVNIARMTDSELCDYIAFTNKTWGAATRLKDFDGYRQEDGRYNVVVAGHSRTISMKNIALKHTLRTGQPTNYTALTKIEKNNSVEAIVSKQFLENIHAAVPPHREAEAIIEMYEQGYGTKWSSPEEFRQKDGKVVSAVVLDKALAYGNLPQQMRNMVANKFLKYPVAIEFGRCIEAMRSYKALQYELPHDQPLPGDIEGAIYAELMAKCTYLRREKFSQTAAVKEVQRLTAKYREDITTALEESAWAQQLPQQVVAQIMRAAGLDAPDAPLRKKVPRSEDVALDLENLMITPEQQYALELKRAQKRQANEAKDMLARQHEQTARFLKAMGENVDNELVEEVVDDAASALEVYASRGKRAQGVGAVALHKDPALEEPDDSMLFAS